MMHRMCAGMLCAALLLGAVAIAPAQDEKQDKVTLEWKFTKGLKLRYEMTQAVETEFGGMEMEQEFLFGMTQEVTELDDKGVATLKVTYDRVKVKMTGMMETEYDSEVDEEPPDDSLGRIMAGFVGKSFTLKLTARGKVLDVKGYEKIMEEIIENMDDEGDMMAEMLRSQYNDEQMEAMMQQSYLLLPEDPVAKGDSWKSETTFPLPMMGKLNMKTKSTLEDIAKGGQEAVIGQVTDIKIEQDDKGDEDDPFGGMVEIIEASAKSKITWNLEKGFLTETKTTMNMTMEAAGQEMEMVMKMTMKHKPDKGRKDVPSEDKDKKEKDKDDY